MAPLQSELTRRGMKYSTRSLMIVAAVVAVMVSTLRVPSDRSVLVLIVCVAAILSFAVRAFLRSKKLNERLFFGTAALTGFGYLVLYVATDTPLEAWVNNFTVLPFAFMKAGSGAVIPDGVELGQLANTSEFQYFQQKMHLLLAVVLAFTSGLVMAGCTDEPLR